MALNPKQAKFIKLYTSRGMSRSAAYMEAYGMENPTTARQSAYRLISTNVDVKQKIDRILADGIQAAKHILEVEAETTAEKLIELRDYGNTEYGVRLSACKDILDRIGLKPKDEVEHSGEVKVTLIDVIRERAKRQKAD